MSLTLKVWNKNTMKVESEMDIAKDQVFGITRYTLRAVSGPQDGCAVTLKDNKRGSGKCYLSPENYSEVCRRFDISAAGASGTPSKPSTLPRSLTPAA